MSETGQHLVPQDDYFGEVMLLHGVPLLKVNVYNKSLRAWLEQLAEERLKPVLDNMNVSAQAQYYRDIHDLDMSPEEWRSFKTDAYTRTVVDTMATYIRENLEAMIKQAAQCWLDEACLVVDDNIVLGGQERISAPAALADKTFKSYASGVKERLKNWGPRKITNLPARNILEGVLPAYHMCLRHVEQIKAKPKTERSAAEQEIYEMVEAYGEKPSHAACYLLLEYPNYKDCFRLQELGYTNAESLYKALLPVIDIEKRMIAGFKARGI